MTTLGSRYKRKGADFPQAERVETPVAGVLVRRSWQNSEVEKIALRLSIEPGVSSLSWSLAHESLSENRTGPRTSLAELRNQKPAPESTEP